VKSKPPKQTSIIDPSHERPLVQDDDVCIHVIGLPSLFTAENAFSAVFGIFEEPVVWKIPGTFFEVFEGKDRFYHGDQMVPTQSPVRGLSINYHGELELSSDRRAIIGSGHFFEQYAKNLTEALDIAISKMPELAVLIMRAILERTSAPGKMKPKSKRYATEYKTAFEAACGKQALPVYPFAHRAMSKDLIRELGFFPWPLHNWQMQILENAGAYISIDEYAPNCLEAADKVPEAEFLGLDLLNRCIRRLIPKLEHDVSVRKYHYSTPRALQRDGHILLAQPNTCKNCPEIKCSCWVGATLVRAMQAYDKDVDLDKIFWEYEQEKTLAEEQERISTQSQVQNVGSGRKDDDLVAFTSIAKTLVSDDSGGEGWNIGAAKTSTAQTKVTTSLNPPPFPRHASTKIRKLRKSDSPLTASRNIVTPQRVTAEPYAIGSKASGDASNNLDTFPGTPVVTAKGPDNVTSESTQTTEVVERMVPAINEIVPSSKAGGFATVHDRLILTINCAEAVDATHRAQVSPLSGENRWGDARLDAAGGSKRKRTREVHCTLARDRTKAPYGTKDNASAV
jgi:hypothetical protein